MKSFFKGLLFILTIGCNPGDSKRSNVAIQSGEDDSSINKIALIKDSVGNGIIPATQRDSVIRTLEKRIDSNRNGIDEKALMILSSKILKCLKEKTYARLAEFIHPKLRVRFSPYGYIDTIMDHKVSSKELIKLVKRQNRIRWGFEDGTDKLIILSIDDYIRKFVYDVDFLNAEKKAVNRFLGGGNSLNNLEEVYPGCNFTEFYFSGFDPKFDGMDWRTLRFVFKEYRKKYYLIAIVHDEWTI